MVSPSILCLAKKRYVKSAISMIRGYFYFYYCRLKFEEDFSSSDSESGSSTVAELEYYDGDKELPIFDKMGSGYPVHLLIKRSGSFSCV